jgi:DhnA family fructose-bisphosphate aldolase class Ia
MKSTIFIPADIPPSQHEAFHRNYDAITRSTGKLFILAADHKMEHLDQDCYGPGIDPAAHHPEHFFAIASQAKIGALAAQLGLIARYGKQYSNINYIVKLNSKTNLIPPQERDPLSRQLWTIDEVVTLKKSSGLPMCGIGLTIYLGSEFEDLMLKQAAHAIQQAHQHGLIAILWMYPRSHSIKDEREHHLLAGAVGVANCLGADFVKIHPPRETANRSSAELLSFVVQAAGNTRVICAGGSQYDPQQLINAVHDQMSIGGSSGIAIGRNIWQHSLKDAIVLADKLSQAVYGPAL